MECQVDKYGSIIIDGKLFHKPPGCCKEGCILNFQLWSLFLVVFSTALGTNVGFQAVDSGMCLSSVEGKEVILHARSQGLI